MALSGSRSAASPQPSMAFETSKKSKGLAAAYKLEIACILKVPSHLMNQEGKVPLTLAYERYKACNKAMQDFSKMKAAGTWPTTCSLPTATDIIEIFISKSMWHQYYVALFSNISRYPDMVEWLEEDGEDRPSSVDVWGFQKNSYTFADLKKWLAEQKSPLAADVEEQMDKKEKGKGGKKEKRKKPRKQSSSEESDSESATREKKKASKGKRAQVEDSADEDSGAGKNLKGKQKAKGGKKDRK